MDASGTKLRVERVESIGRAEASAVFMTSPDLSLALWLLGGLSSPDPTRRTNSETLHDTPSLASSPKESAAAALA